MIQRNINPKPRFVTLTSGPSTGALVGVPLATLYKAAFFRFPQDSIIHYVMVNSTLTSNGALSQAIGAVAYGQGDQTIGDNLSAGLDNFTDNIIWRDEVLNPIAGVISEGKSTQGTNTLELNLETLKPGLHIVQLVQEGSKQQVNLMKK
jgi:hypothetical protein